MRRTFIIDGSKFNDIEGFYCEIDNLLTKDLDWETGHNLNAFNDLLRGGFGVHEYGEPIRFLWVDYSKSKKDFGYEATIKHYEQMLKRCHPTNGPHVEELLEQARNHQGETLLDIIVSIILDTDNSGHECTLETFD